MKKVKTIAATLGVAVSILLGSINVGAVPVSEFTPSDSREILLDRSIEVTLSDSNISEWFLFVAPSDGVYAFYTDAVPATVDPILFLFDEDMNMIEFNDDTTTTTTSSNAYVSAVMNEGELYYIKVQKCYSGSGSFNVYAARGVAVFFDIDGTRVYNPWDSNDSYSHDYTDTHADAGSNVTLNVVGDIDFELTSLAGFLESCTMTSENRSVIFSDFEEGLGGFRLEFTIGSVRVTRTLRFKFHRLSDEDHLQGVIDGGTGYQYGAYMLPAGGSATLSASTPYTAQTNFYGNMISSAGCTSFSDKRQDGDEYRLSIPLRNIDRFTVVVFVTSCNTQFGYLTDFVFVPESNAPAMSLDTDYHCEKRYSTSEEYHERAVQFIYSFTPDRSGSYTFSTGNRNMGIPNISVFNSDNTRVGSVFSTEHRSAEELNRNMYGLSEYYYTYAEEVSDYDPDNCWIVDDTMVYDDVTLTLDLQAGQTYYVAVGSLDPIDYDIRVTCNEPAVTQAPSTPAPSTPAPSTPAPSTPAPTQNVGTSSYNVSDFVERLYTVALGRASDPAGKQNWIDAVTMRGETGADLARGFLYSPEFLNKDVSNEDFVKVLYRTFFNREADADGLNAWVNVLNNGESKENVIEGFINSSEWANLCLLYGIRGGGTGTPTIEVEPNSQTIEFATRLYTTCLGRAADEAGMMAWARQLANQRDTGTGAARGFFFSNEFTGQNVSNAEFVNRLYRTFMGREADEAGFSAWVAQLDGGVSREEVFNGFAQSTEFARICASYGIVR